MEFPVYLSIAGVRLHPHFVFESLAYAIALRLLLWNRRPDDISTSQRTSVVVGGMVGALIGAKLLVMVQHLNLLWTHWQHWLLLLIQGKTVIGALLGGLIGVEVTKNMIGVTQSTGDRFVYPLMVGTAIGRIGCFLTGLSDRTYGTATSLPWGIDFGDGIARHPTQIYEIGFLLALILFLRWRDRYPRQAGDLFRFYMVGYLSFRFGVDFLKPDFQPLLGLSAIQLACLLGLLYYRRSWSRLIPWRRAAAEP